MWLAVLLAVGCEDSAGRDPTIGAMSGGGSGSSASGGSPSSGGQGAGTTGGAAGAAAGSGTSSGGAAGVGSGGGPPSGGSSGVGGSGGIEPFPPACVYHSDPPPDEGAAGAAGAGAGAAITVQSSPTVGSYLADSAGRPLYIFTSDAAGDCSGPPQSRCADACEAEWPIFDAAPRTLDARLNDADFGQIARASGAPSQTTYRGWPLYYSAADVAAGQTTGHGRGRVWFLARVPLYSVITMRVDTVRPLGDGTGRVLFTFADDTWGASPSSACTDACAEEFPPFSPAHLTLAPLLESSAFATFARADGRLQVAYNGAPLYYVRSAAPGTIPELPAGWTAALP